MKIEKEMPDDELQQLSPFLRELRGKDDGFRLPPTYFDGLEDEVFKSIDALGARRRPAASAPGSAIRQWLAAWWQPRIALALGGVIALVVAGWWLLRPAPVPADVSPVAVRTEEATPEDIEAYVLENVQDFDTDQLIALAVADEPAPATETKPRSAPETSATPAARPGITEELSPEELEMLLDDLTDEELEKLL